MVCKCYSIVSFHNFATTSFVFLSLRHTFVPNGYFSPSSPPPLPSPLFPLTCDFCFIFPQIPFSPPRFPSLFLSPFPLSFLIFPHFTPLLHLCPLVHLRPPVSMLSICVGLVHLCPCSPFVSVLSICVRSITSPVPPTSHPRKDDSSPPQEICTPSAMSLVVFFATVYCN